MNSEHFLGECNNTPESEQVGDEHVEREPIVINIVDNDCVELDGPSGQVRTVQTSELTDEQKERIELKRAQARKKREEKRKAKSLQQAETNENDSLQESGARGITTEQRARMEAKRMQAMERRAQKQMDDQQQHYDAEFAAMEETCDEEAVHCEMNFSMTRSHAQVRTRAQSSTQNTPAAGQRCLRPESKAEKRLRELRERVLAKEKAC